jgi:hypothetical protein
VSRVSEIIESMVHAVPAQKANLDEVEVTRLRELTGELIADRVHRVDADGPARAAPPSPPGRGQPGRDDRLAAAGRG